jgi:hypothetical protein
MPSLIIKHTDGSKRIVQLSDKIFFSKSTGHKLDGDELRKRINRSAEGLAGNSYQSHYLILK